LAAVIFTTEREEVAHRRARRRPGRAGDRRAGGASRLAMVTEVQVSAGEDVVAAAEEEAHVAVEAAGEASASAALACPLLELSYDELSVLVHSLCDPLQPQLALQLSSVASGIRAPMKAQLLELRAQHEAALQLAALYTRQSGLPWSCADLRDAEQLLLGDFHGRPLSSTHWRTLGNLAARQCLRKLGTLVVIEDSGNGDEGVGLFSAGLRRGCLPSLTRLGFSNSQLGPVGAAALAAALTSRAVPALQILRFGQSQIGDAGMISLAAPLRRLPALQVSPSPSPSPKP
jgi:hypothetical protein